MTASSCTPVYKPFTVAFGALFSLSAFKKSFTRLSLNEAYIPDPSTSFAMIFSKNTIVSVVVQFQPSEPAVY